MPERVICDLCGTAVAPHAHYVVRISVFADPTPQAISTEELADGDFGQTYAELVKQMSELSAEELQDQVHRSFEYRLCGPCQARYLANPLGKPRETRAGTN